MADSPRRHIFFIRRRLMLPRTLQHFVTVYIIKTISSIAFLKLCPRPSGRPSPVIPAPFASATRVESGSGTRSIGTTVMENWTYDRGTQAAPMLVTIAAGKVRAIELVR